jgi:hypothetical protein
LDDLEQKYQQLITAKKWEGVGHVDMDLHSKSSYHALADPDHKNNKKCYAAYLKTKSHMPFEE